MLWLIGWIDVATTVVRAIFLLGFRAGLDVIGHVGTHPLRLEFTRFGGKHSKRSRSVFPPVHDAIGLDIAIARADR